MGANGAKWAGTLLLVWLGVFGAMPASAAEDAKLLNKSVVTIMSGGPGGTYIRMAHDLAVVHDDLDDYSMRVLAVAGRGSVQNIKDLLFVKGVDLAIVQSDALDEYKRKGRRASILRYISPLHFEEVHVLARKDVANMEDLKGRKVAVGGLGSGTWLTTRLVLAAYQLDVKAIRDDAATALARLKKGEIDAMFYVAGKPAGLFKGLTASNNLHFLDVRHSGLEELYPARELTSQDYRVISGDPVRTVAVRAVLAAVEYRSSARRAKISRFVERFFGCFGKLKLLGRTPKWQDVTIGDSVFGWKRLESAQAWLNKNPLTSVGEGDLAQVLKLGDDPVLRALYIQELKGRYGLGAVAALEKMSPEQLVEFAARDRNSPLLRGSIGLSDGSRC